MPKRKELQLKQVHEHCRASQYQLHRNLTADQICSYGITETALHRAKSAGGPIHYCSYCNLVWTENEFREIPLGEFKKEGFVDFGSRGR